MLFLSYHNLHIHFSSVSSGFYIVCVHTTYIYAYIYLKILFIYLRGSEGERKRNIGARDLDWLPLVCPELGTWPPSQASALTGNRTGDLLVCRLALLAVSQMSNSCIFYSTSLATVVSNSHFANTLSNLCPIL